jgi:zona occludens toxin (predicted ATPase)
VPIEFFTGLPGNGKIAFMVEKLIVEFKKAERPIIAAGIDGLVLGLAIMFDDPRTWNDHDSHGEKTCDCHGDGALHAHKIPDGSLIFVDEAWKWFGHLYDASRQAMFKYVLALAEHRYCGIDFVWTTQQPNQIYPFARALGARHTHVVRRFGTQYCDLYTWEELNEDVKSSAKRENATKQIRMLPAEVFEKYKSVTQHTIRRRLPLKLFVLPVALVVFVGLVYFVY